MKHIGHLTTAIVCTVTFAAFAVPAAAAVAVFNARSAFDAAAGMTTAESFNSIIGQPDFRTAVLDVGAFSLLGFGTQSDRNFIDQPPFVSSELDIDGTTNVSAYTRIAAGFEITFDAPIRAFGADFAGLQREGIRTNIDVTGVTLTPPMQPLDRLTFFGVISTTAFSTVRFIGVGAIDNFAFDNVAYGPGLQATVPEPTSWAMFILGFGLVGGNMRLRNPIAALAA